jgi:hypothetical protein
MLTTTLSLLRQHEACMDRYTHLRNALGKGYGDKPIAIVKILETNGLDDALWALRAVPEEQASERDLLSRTFACRSVRETPLVDGRRVWDLLEDERSRAAVVAAEGFIAGKISAKDLAAARAAARDAAWAAARAAAWDAAWAAARAAARAAAWDAAWDAARAAAWDAARDAAWAAARAAARAAQEKIFHEVFAEPAADRAREVAA